MIDYKQSGAAIYPTRASIGAYNEDNFASINFLGYKVVVGLEEIKDAEARN